MTAIKYLAQVEARIVKANAGADQKQRHAARFSLGYDAEELLRMLRVAMNHGLPTEAYAEMAAIVNE